MQRVGLPWLVAIAVAAGGCRAIAGVDDREPIADATDAAVGLAALACGALPALGALDPAECRACLAESCCGEVAACRGDAACAAALACVAACATSDDPACVTRCEADDAPTRALVAQALACRVRACAAPCGEVARCGRPPGPADACASCVEGACCAEALDYWGNADARELAPCLAACDADDVACHERCASARPAGHARTAALRACAASSCAAGCGAPEGVACGTYGAADGCASCMVAKCCGALFDCNSDPACASYAVCLARCGSDAACALACADEAPTLSLARFDVRDACLATSCGAPCGVAAAARCALFVPSPTCLDCLDTSCCDEGVAAGVDLAQRANQRCRANCTNARCEGDCATAFPPGATLDDLNACLARACTDACFAAGVDAGAD